MELRDFMLCVEEAKNGDVPAKEALPWVAYQYSLALTEPQEVVPLDEYFHALFPEIAMKIDLFGTFEDGAPLAGRIIYNDPNVPTEKIMEALKSWSIEYNISVEISVVNDGAD